MGKSAKQIVLEYFDRLLPKFEAYVARGLRRDKVAWYFEKKKIE